MIIATDGDADRFWSKVDRSSDCWMWLAYTNGNGYGTFRHGGRAGRMFLAPRVAWELTFGPIPAGLQVRHSCDNPTCVRPTHLSLGTHSDNTTDRVSRNRQAKGTSFPQARLTDEIVREIRRLYQSAEGTQRQLAAIYGVSQSVISNVVNRRRWRHVV